jgi:CDP-glucose 4,6-dehydratase
VNTKTYLITGSSGFVGGALTKRLLRSRERVVTLVRDGEPPTLSNLPKPEIVRGDVEDLRTLERVIAEYQPDTIFHLAAQAIVGTSKRDPYGTLETNVRGTYAMLEAFRRQRKSKKDVLVIASSDKAYGDTKILANDKPFEERLPYREGDPLQGRGIYDVSKSCCDMIAQSYAEEFALNVGIVRAGNIYGPGDTDMTRIIPSMMESIRLGYDPVILSDGTPVRDYLYIDDAVDAYIQLGSKLEYDPRGQSAFNFAGGEPISVIDLVNFTLELLDKKHLRPDVRGSRRGEIQHQVLDTSAARQIMGWKPHVNLAAGLKKTWDALTWEKK